MVTVSDQVPRLKNQQQFQILEAPKNIILMSEDILIPTMIVLNFALKKKDTFPCPLWQVLCNRTTQFGFSTIIFMEDYSVFN
jgi:hypothetical protein